MRYLPPARFGGDRSEALSSHVVGPEQRKDLDLPTNRVDYRHLSPQRYVNSVRDLPGKEAASY